MTHPLKTAPAKCPPDCINTIHRVGWERERREGRSTEVDVYCYKKEKEFK